MKKIYKNIPLIIAFVSFVVLSSCDKGFEKTNTDPVSLKGINPSYLFSEAQRLCVTSVVDYDASIIQQIITVQPGTLAGANFNIDLDINTRKSFINFYANGPIRNLVAIIDQTKGDPNNTNLYNMARILRAYVFQILVDTYGDVPYSEAGLAFLNDIYLPKYDHAEDIYNDLLQELEEATKALDATKPLATQELFYMGNIAQWKKLGNSLLLRVAMRLTKVDPAKAEANVKIAIDPANGGLIESINDNAKIQFNNIFTNSAVGAFQSSERGNYYLAAPFVDYLKSTDDPRLKRISVRYQFPGNLLGSTGTEDTDPAHQIGMPYGFNGGNITEAPGFPGTIGAGFGYSQPNRSTLTAQAAPAFLVTASQTLLLEAEAAQRGWISGVAATFYISGVKADMDQFSQYGGSTSEIPTASQNAYLAEHPFDESNALNQINTQYWISSYAIWTEAWANFRRSGFPLLEPNPYPQQDPAVKGGFIRRMPYPDRELSVNEVNVKAAIARQGSDNLATRVFWDLP